MAMPEERHLTVCVDDFGLHAGVNEAVHGLVAQGRVTAVSCLVDGVAWRDGVVRLREVAGQGDGRRADVGLHLNFTDALQLAGVTGSAWTATPVSRLIVRTYTRRVDDRLLRTEIERQWDRFEAAWGQAPDFVDGHQHVHQLPQIREALMAVLDARASRLPAGFWLRDGGTSVMRQLGVGVPWADALKAGLISALGSAWIRQAAARRGWRTSAGLLGSYPFNTDEAGYLRLWRAWLAMAPARDGLLMCHPSAGEAGSQAHVSDPIAAARAVEYRALRGDAFGRQLEAARARIARLGPNPES